jgi:Tfp pilus assembly protein PilO
LEHPNLGSYTKKMKLKLYTREKIIVFSTVCLGAVLLWYKLLYLPEKYELESIREELTSIQMQHEPFSKNSTFRPSSIFAEEAAISAQYNELTARIPERDEIPSAMIQMIRPGQGRNIRIISVRPVMSQLFENHTLPDEFQLKEVPVDIVLEGKFVDIGRYLFDLMSLPFFGGYNNLQMETSEEMYPEINAKITCILLFFNNS